MVILITVQSVYTTMPMSNVYDYVRLLDYV